MLHVFFHLLGLSCWFCRVIRIFRNVFWNCAKTFGLRYDQHSSGYSGFQDGICSNLSKNFSGLIRKLYW